MCITDKIAAPIDEANLETISFKDAMPKTAVPQLNDLDEGNPTIDANLDTACDLDLFDAELDAFVDDQPVDHILKIKLEQDQKRLDSVLASQLVDISRSEIRKWMDDQRVMINGKPVKPSEKWPLGTPVVIRRPAKVALNLEGEPMPLDICYEDDYLMVINKPQGIVVHPGPGHHTGTLVHGLIHYLGGKEKLSQVQAVERPGIVHRIDKDTSGLLLVMKDDRAHRIMAERIAAHDVERHYLAIVHGHFTEESGTIVAAIGRDPNYRQKMTVTPDGKSAITHFRVQAPLHHTSLVELKLETGRTHQIRVHMKYIGHPVVGDPLYSGNRKNYGFSGQALHAGRLIFDHPITNERIEVEAPLPSFFESKLIELGYEQTKHWLQNKTYQINH